jgi:hypothetical protein
MRIDSSGKVGIGETSMDALLVIKGDSNSSTNPSIRLKDGTDSREAIVSNQSGDLVLATMNSSDNVIDSAITIYTSQMIFKTNGSEAMRFDNSQNVGIGTSSPSNKLVVQTTSDPNEGTIVVQRNSEASGAYCGYGFRTQSSNTDFAKGAIYFKADGSGYGRGDMLFCVDGSATSPNEVRPSDAKMSILRNGRVCINRTSSVGAAKLDISHPGSSEYGLTLDSSNTSGTQYHLDIRRGGTQAGYLVSQSATTVNLANASDERLKENIQNSNSAIQDIKDMQVRQFDWVDAIDTHKDFGFVAQELVNVVPEAVTQGTDELDENGKPVRTWGVDYSHIVPRLVKVCQEQQTKIEDLEARILALETTP